MYNFRMGLNDWIKGFRELHELAKKGDLSAARLGEYQEAREELAAALVGAQRLQIPEGESARRVLRVARAVQITLEMTGGLQKGMTVDLSQSGFGALIGKAPEPKESVGVQLRLPGDPNLLLVRARAQNSRRQGGTYRVSFVFEEMPKEDAGRLGFAIFDTVLAQLAGS